MVLITIWVCRACFLSSPIESVQISTQTMKETSEKQVEIDTSDLFCSDLCDSRSSKLSNPCSLGSGEPPGHLCAPVHVPHPVPVLPLRSSCPPWFVSALCFIIPPVSAQPFKLAPSEYAKASPAVEWAIVK